MPHSNQALFISISGTSSAFVSMYIHVFVQRNGNQYTKELEMSHVLCKFCLLEVKFPLSNNTH